MNTRWILLISLLSLALGSCGGSQVSVRQSTDPTPLNPQEISTEVISSPLPENPIQLARTPETPDMTSNPPSVDKFIQIAKQDLAGSLKIDANQISLIKTVEITWPNTALGCPSPGKVYASVRVPGYQVRLQANGMEYIYNMDMTGKFILCPQLSDEPGESSNTIPGPTLDPNIGVPIK